MRLLSSLSLSFKLPFARSIIVATVAATIGVAMVDRDQQRLREELRVPGEDLVDLDAVVRKTPAADWRKPLAE